MLRYLKTCGFNVLSLLFPSYTSSVNGLLIDHDEQEVKQNITSHWRHHATLQRAISQGFHLFIHTPKTKESSGFLLIAIRKSCWGIWGGAPEQQTPVPPP